MKYFSKKRFTMRQVVGLLTFVFLGITVIAYAAVTVPNTFTTGPISSSQVNANFTTLGNAMPAVKEVSFTNSAAFTSTSVTSVGSITVTPPVSGFIILTGSGDVGVNQTVADNNYVSIYLATTSTGTTNTSYHVLDTTTTGVSGIRNWVPFSKTAVFSVTGGVASTFYMTAFRDNSANGNFYLCYNACRLTAIFVPGTALP